ncbi:MAG: TrkA C-terminal domain-containing protein [Bacillota bacterium]|nr:TrkA C-terminal domain-containing protein [Bacillota bacterium]
MSSRPPARYEEIAMDLARRIKEGELREGQRISTRSLLSAHYQVSPETARRAVALLHAQGVLQAMAGSGVVILSQAAAEEFLLSMGTRLRVVAAEEELRQLLRQRAQLDEKIESALRTVIQNTQRLLALAGDVDEVSLPSSSWAHGRSIRELEIRARTGATVLTVVRGSSEHFSPSPDFVLQGGDLIIVSGDAAARQRAREYLLNPEGPALSSPRPGNMVE